MISSELRQDQTFSITTIRDLYDQFIGDRKWWRRWVFRGQERDWALASTIERAAEIEDIDREKLAEIELSVLRDFRRKYEGADRDAVQNDTLYGLSVLQHFGGPTRLLDFTYSPWVALYFALENVGSTARVHTDDWPVVWCINADWNSETASQRDLSGNLKPKRPDTSRNEKLFLSVYYPDNRKYSSFVHVENPMRLHQRLVVQQGVFLCSANLSIPSQDVLLSMPGAKDKDRIWKLRIDPRIREDVLDVMRNMNVTRASLFPGLAGFAASYKTSLKHLEKVLAGREDSPP
ncbi:MAG TPA: FRG domain-containing protein [bacterium]